MPETTKEKLFSLTLFSTRVEFICQAVAAGVDEVIVDWEHIGKSERQAGADTQINHDTLDDLRHVRACTSARVICRINRFGQWTPSEVEMAIEAGADELLLPMVRCCDEVESVLNMAGSRCGVGILVETVDAIHQASLLAKLPISRVYVGLNDLAIERHSSNIFVPLLDGTLESVRSAFKQPFGFGGLTLPDRGHPVPCRLLIAEMARLNCQFSFLRRSFHRDIQGRDMAVEIPRLLQAIEQAHKRTPDSIAQDRRELEEAIHIILSRQIDEDRTCLYKASAL
ncbi:MAG: aldolase/citrate lyase family protein [Anaerolineae bacterium]|nr:HpcH/HpaI aldolase/citrate lyase family protein [Thermoflexales bacterium]MDW8407255.1 aldolase/citrate lyase family protein [Anaerolineae bacterium]